MPALFLCIAWKVPRQTKEARPTSIISSAACALSDQSSAADDSIVSSIILLLGEKRRSLASLTAREQRPICLSALPEVGSFVVLLFLHFEVVFANQSIMTVTMMEQQTLPKDHQPLPASVEPEEEKSSVPTSAEQVEDQDSLEETQKHQLPVDSQSAPVSPEPESDSSDHAPLQTLLKSALRQQTPSPVFIDHEQSTCEQPPPPTEQPSNASPNEPSRPHVQFDSITIHYHGIALGDSPSTHKGPPIALDNELICSEKYPSLEHYEHERFSHRHKKRATRTSAKFRQQVLLRAGVTHSQIQERIQELAEYHHNMEYFGAVSSAVLPHYHFGKGVTQYSYGGDTSSTTNTTPSSGDADAPWGSSTGLWCTRMDELETSCYAVVAPQESDVSDVVVVGQQAPHGKDPSDGDIHVHEPPSDRESIYPSKPTVQSIQKQDSCKFDEDHEQPTESSIFDCLSIC